MSDCIAEKLCHLLDDPDDNEALEGVSLCYEGRYDSDDVSVTDKFRCGVIGCSALIACVQWYREETDESGSIVYKISG